MTRIAIIGGGQIGEALLAGLLRAGRAVKDLVVAEPSGDRAEALAREYGVRVTTTADAAEGADLIVIAVKPAAVENVLDALAKVELNASREQLLVTLAAGIPAARYEAKLPAGFPVVRVMPNTPMLVGEGMSVLAAGRYAKPEHLAMVSELLHAVGEVATVPESQLDAVTATSGSGPAYFFLIAEAMIDAAVGLGLSRPVATALVKQTMAGSAAMLAGGDNATDLRASVTSPAGTTAAAVRQLERQGVRSALADAMYAARDRSAELGQEPPA